MSGLFEYNPDPAARMLGRSLTDDYTNKSPYLFLALSALAVIGPLVQNSYDSVHGVNTEIRDKTIATIPARLLGYKQYATNMTEADKYYTDYMSGNIALCQKEFDKINSRAGLEAGTAKSISEAEMFRAITLNKILYKLQEAVAKKDVFLKEIDGLNEYHYSEKIATQLKWIVRDAMEETGTTTPQEKGVIENLFSIKPARRDDYNLNESTNKATPAATVTEITSSANIKFTPALTRGA